MSGSAKTSIPEVKFSFWERWRFQEAIERFYGNRFGVRHFTADYKYTTFEKGIDTIPSRVAAKILRIGASKKSAALAALRSANSEPFLIFRSYGLVPFLYPLTPQALESKIKEKGGRAKTDADGLLIRPMRGLEATERRIDTLIGATLCELGADAYERSPGSKIMHRDFQTQARAQQLCDKSTADVALRFLTSATEYRLPYSDAARFSQTETKTTCAYTTYFCMNNWPGIPLFVLPVRKVISEIRTKNKTWIIDELTKYRFLKVPARADGYEQHSSEAPHPLLMKDPSVDGEDEYICSYDPSRVWPSNKDGNSRSALLAFREIVDSVAKAHSRAIILHRNDLLLVDNLRCLVGRYEVERVSFLDSVNQSVFGNRMQWWLRQHFGFPQKHADHRATQGAS